MEAFLEERSSIYRKEIVYTYKYSFTRNNITTTGKIYLGCLGKLWPIKEQEQFAIIWTESEKALLEKSFETGVIEDSSRIFLHPPRKDKFNILEYSPFPEINFPLTEGKTWNWDLTVGRFWQKNIGLDTTANDTLKYIYKIENLRQFYFHPTKSMVEGYEVKATSLNPKFDSEFTGLFNSSFGFIRMKFNNIDGSECIFDLTNVCSFDEIKNSTIIDENNRFYFKTESWK